MIAAIISALAAAWHALALYILVSAALLFVQPTTSHTDLAIANTSAILLAAPLVDDEKAEISIVTGNETEESSLRTDAIGDHGLSSGPMQIFRARPMTTTENVMAGIEQLRISFALCKSAPFADYVFGPKGCTSDRARRLSKHRERLVARILASLMSTGEEIARK